MGEREPSRAFGDASKSFEISPEAHSNRTRFPAMTWSSHERWFRHRIKSRLESDGATGLLLACDVFFLSFLQS
ncbi:hypothetical protein BHE74_00013323 [Ensete ventricosum]|nr:hypothetical protein BHE74_00013323 [Ensete ventricosum]